MTRNQISPPGSHHLASRHQPLPTVLQLVLVAHFCNKIKSAASESISSPHCYAGLGAQRCSPDSVALCHHHASSWQRAEQKHAIPHREQMDSSFVGPPAPQCQQKLTVFRCVRLAYTRPTRPGSTITANSTQLIVMRMFCGPLRNSSLRSGELALREDWAILCPNRTSSCKRARSA